MRASDGVGHQDRGMRPTSNQSSPPPCLALPACLPACLPSVCAAGAGIANAAVVALPPRLACLPACKQPTSQPAKPVSQRTNPPVPVPQAAASCSNALTHTCLSPDGEKNDDIAQLVIPSAHLLFQNTPSSLGWTVPYGRHSRGADIASRRPNGITITAFHSHGTPDRQIRSVRSVGRPGCRASCYSIQPYLTS